MNINFTVKLGKNMYNLTPGVHQGRIQLEWAGWTTAEWRPKTLNRGRPFAYLAIHAAVFHSGHQDHCR